MHIRRHRVFNVVHPNLLGYVHTTGHWQSLLIKTGDYIIHTPLLNKRMDTCYIAGESNSLINPLNSNLACINSLPTNWS